LDWSFTSAAVAWNASEVTYVTGDLDKLRQRQAVDVTPRTALTMPNLL